jgi:hypothetical protein
VFPEWVDFDANGYRMLTMRGLEPLVVESIRVLKTENDDLRKRVRLLETSRESTRAGLGNGFVGASLGLAIAAALVALRRREQGVGSR